jgi:hypothetical protein
MPRRDTLGDYEVGSWHVLGKSWSKNTSCWLLLYIIMKQQLEVVANWGRERERERRVRLVYEDK